MNSKSTKFFVLSVLTACLFTVSVPAQEKGLKTITKEELKHHLNFIASEEFNGRETPSIEQEICNRYIVNLIQSYGVKPLMKDGSYFQTIPITVTKVSPFNSKLSISSATSKMDFYYEQEFGGSFSSSRNFSGDLVFLGYGLSAPDKNWDDLKDINISGKIAVILDAEAPNNAQLTPRETSLNARVNALSRKGAAAVLVVLSPGKQAKKDAGINIFFTSPRGRMIPTFETQQSGTTRPPQPAQPAAEVKEQRPTLPFGQAEISHIIAGSILNVQNSELLSMFNSIKGGNPVKPVVLSGKRAELNIEILTTKGTTRSVLGLIEGTDSKLKDEYVVISGHQDHLGVQKGEVIPGADDNGSATVALLEMAQAFVKEPTKRSIILAWFTGEERGLMGSHFFVNNCPVPVEKISACLNMDMLARNNRDSLFLVASDMISSELDGAINEVNKKFNINFGFSYVYSNTTNSSRVYYRSDQYPHIRYGIPSVWIFCGFTPDYHTPKDNLQFADDEKMFKSTKLVYLTANKIANMKELLKLDKNPDVTTRGKHNLKVESIK